MANFVYHEPGSVAEAVELLARYDGEAKVVAGGQSLMILLVEGLVQPQALVALQGISALSNVWVQGGALMIGANVTHAQVHMHPVVRQRWPLLAEVVGSVATVQVRNRGTVCGSLAHGFPLSDPPAGLLVLDAEVRICSPTGERAVPLDEFFFGFLVTQLRADDVLTHVIVPAVPPRTGGAYRTLRTRPLDFPLAGVAARLSLAEDGTCTTARVALTGGGPTPTRAMAAEAILGGRVITPELIALAAQAVAENASPAADIDGSETYKRRMLGVLARRALAAALARLACGAEP